MSTEVLLDTSVESTAVVGGDKVSSESVSGTMSVPLGDMTSSPSGAPFSLSNCLRLPSGPVREWLLARRINIQPWLLFANVNHFSKPASLTKWSKRLMRNVHHFQSNYALVLLVLFVYCVLTSPLLLVGLGASGAGCRLLTQRQAERPLVLAGRQVPLRQQYMAVAALTVPLLLLLGASSALFWVLGASLSVVLLHASFFQQPQQPGDDQEDDLEQLFEVTTESV